jgi:hypothetical protein
VCLPLEAKTETVDSPVDSHQWSHHSGFTRCTVAIFYVPSSFVPSELVSFVIQTQGKYLISSSATMPKMLAPNITYGLWKR